jgi:hypothetical protein
MAALSSCTKPGNESGEGQTGSVKIMVTYPDNNANTRAEGAPLADGSKLELKPGHIFFCTSDGTIDTHVGIGTEATPSKDGRQQVTVEDITDSKGSEAVINVLSTATTCYIVSNDDAVFTGAAAITGDYTGSKIDDIFAKPVSVGTINSSATPGGTDKILLFGKGTVNPGAGTTATGNIPYSASVNVKLQPLASRLQIGKITGVPTTDNTTTPATTWNIQSFTVGGIYINYTDGQMTIDPATGKAAGVPASFVSNGSDPAKYTKAAYGSDLACLVDEFTGGRAASGTPNLFIKPASTNLWVYNLFPTEVAHVIVHIENVTYTDGTTPTSKTDKWLTVRNFKRADNNEAIMSFEPGKIYTLTDIQFNKTHVDGDDDDDDNKPEPEKVTVDCLVSVEMMPWEEIEIVWSGN